MQMTHLPLRPNDPERLAAVLDFINDINSLMSQNYLQLVMAPGALLGYDLGVNCLSVLQVADCCDLKYLWPIVRR